jgi:hypothetical protein
MKMTVCAWAAAAAIAGAGFARAEVGTETATNVTRKVVEARPISQEVSKGLGWLIGHQLPGGGWGQGEESSQMGGGETLRDVPNVADTCMACLALLRSGSTPAGGEYAGPLRRGVAFVCEQVRNSDETSLYVTEIRGTRLQGKIGTYVDTFLAAQMLTEMRDVMPDDASRSKVSNCLAKVIRKIETNQKQDGGWSGDGWAPVHSEALATKALNRAAAKGVAVDEQVRLKAQEKAGSKFDRGSGEFRKDGSAGIDLYAVSSTLNSMQESQNYNATVQQQVQQTIARGGSESAVSEARDRLDKFEDNRKALEASRTAVVEKLDDERFIAGFGNNGGEEFLSYLNIGESLVVEGGEPWTKWDDKIGANLKRIQNGDGSWSGHHCITGRSFCTATALLVLMVDRMTLPAGQALTKR